MKYLIVVFAIILILSAYSMYSFVRKVRISKMLVAQAAPYTLKPESNDVHGISVLVLGDSTAVGVGASSPEDSLAALLAHEVHAIRVDNFALSGARVRDLAKEIEQIRREKYTYILVGIGANDVIRFGDANSSAEHLKTVLEGLPAHDHLVVYMAGNVGGSQLFPKFLNPSYTRRTLEYHAAFESVVASVGGVYVNLYVDPARDPFTQDPATYLAADGLHPTSAGYKLWFEKIRAAL